MSIRATITMTRWVGPLKSEESGYQTAYSQRICRRLRSSLLDFSLKYIQAAIKRKWVCPIYSAVGLSTREKHLDALISAKNYFRTRRKMTIEKIPGIASQDNQIPPRSGRNMNSKSLGQALRRQKGRRRGCAFNKSFKLWHKIFKLVYLQQQPKPRASSQALASHSHMDLAMWYSVISVKVTSTTSNT